MKQGSVKISDVLTTEYSDFLDFCADSGKHYIWELTCFDYVAFRTSSGQSREYVATIRNIIETPEFSEYTQVCKEESTPVYNFITKSEEICNDESESISSVGERHDIAEYNEENSIRSSTISYEYVESNTTGNENVPIVTSDELTLAELWNVSPSNFQDTQIDELDLSVRSSNCLKRKNCFTVAVLLTKTITDLKDIPNMGKKSIDEILMKTKALIVPASDDILTDELKVVVDAMLMDNEYNIDSLTEEQRQDFNRYVEATDVIGKDMCLNAYLAPEYTFEICKVLWKFGEANILHKKAIEDTHQHIARLSSSIKENRVIPFIQAYTASTEDKLSRLLTLCDESANISSIPFLLESIKETESAEALIDEVSKFLNWLDFDIDTITQNTNNNIRTNVFEKNMRIWYVIIMRAEGITLEEIGTSLEVSRERVRQIERKAYALFWREYLKQKYDLIMLVYALLNGEPILNYDEIKETLGDFAPMLWFCLKSVPNQRNYYYSKDIDAVVIINADSNLGKEEELINKRKNAIASLPPVIHISDAELEIEKAAVANCVTTTMLKNHLNNHYRTTGQFYHIRQLSVVFMCEYVLKERFKMGFKTGDTYEEDRFRKYMVEFFGDRANRITNRAIDAKVGEIGCLCDRGKYIHPSYIDVDKDIIDEVNAYIENSPRVVLTYIELFDTFSELFSGTQINNRYFLQGVLKHLGCPFVMRKDYITKASDVNLASEFEHFVEQSGRVHKSVLLEEFNGLSEINIGFFCQRLSTIVVLDGGYYMHSSQLNISDEDYNEQRKFLLTACCDTPASTRALYNEYMMRFTDFMIRNSIESQGNLFGVLQYMFRKEFFFSRPYISLSNDLELTHRGVLLQHLSGIDSIEIEDLTDICDKNGIHFPTVRHMMKSIEPDFIRVGNTMLMRKERAGVDDDSVLDTVQQIIDIVHVRGGYCASKNIDDFSWFPELNVPWNAYLLESVSALAGDLLTVLRINTNTIYTPVDVYIGDEFVDEDTNSLILRLLIKEHQFEPFLSKEDVYNWLQEQGLCNAVLPLFLETEGHLFYNESGKLTVQ